VLGSSWTVGAGLGFDRETDRSRAESKVTDTFNAVATISYGIGSFSLITGLSKGFADTDNPEGNMNWTDGDWGTGLILAYSILGFPSSESWMTTISVGYEYNLTGDEPDLSFDAGVGYLF
jgi:hypothetical protein